MTDHVHITLAQLLKHFPAGTEFSYCTQFGPVDVLEAFYTGMGELVFRTKYGNHYTTADELIQVSKADYDLWMLRA